MTFNYCIISENKIYTELYDLIENDDLHMGKETDDGIIYTKIKQFIESETSCPYFKFSEPYTCDKDVSNDIIKLISKNGTIDNVSTEITTLFSNEDTTYELIYINYINNGQTDDDVNQFASLTNMNLIPIYKKCAITKVSHINNNINNVMISTEDMLNILINNFYHTGVMIDGDKLTEINFCGQMPHTKIGNNFQTHEILNILGFSFICYHENCKNNNDNKISTIFCGKNITNRIFVTLLSYEKNKKTWNVTSSLINKIIKIKSDETLLNIFNNNISDLPYDNYFATMSKYC